MTSLLCRVVLLSMVMVSGLRAQTNPDWTTNHRPFRVIGNVYYVGSKDLASYLVVTPEGAILINSNLASSVPQIAANIKALGFKMSDVKVLLISHAHADHDAGSAGLLRLTHAKYEVMDADVPVVESGGKADFFYGGRKDWSYPPAKVDRVLHDGDEVRLGGTTLVAHLTPGHTKGCTTWTMKVAEGGKSYNVVIVGSTSINPGYRLVGDPKYSGMASDFAKTFEVLRGLPCDVFLGAHGSYFGMEEKLGRVREGEANPFIDPAGYRAFVAEREKVFRVELGKQGR